jgi:hypothetical protein
VLVDETKYDTWVTQTLLVAFMKIWESVPLQSSGDLDVFTRKTLISAWLAKLFPKMRISAPHLWNLLVYVDYRVRGETLDSYRVDCSTYGELLVNPIFVHRYILGRPPEGGVRERVRRSQEPMVMNDLTLDQLGLYSREARNCLDDFLKSAVDQSGPLADAIAQLNTFGTKKSTNSFAIFARLDGIANAVAVGSDHDAMELYHGPTTQPSLVLSLVLQSKLAIPQHVRLVTRLVDALAFRIFVINLPGTEAEALVVRDFGSGVTNPSSGGAPGRIT